MFISVVGFYLSRWTLNATRLITMKYICKFQFSTTLKNGEKNNVMLMFETKYHTCKFVKFEY